MVETVDFNSFLRKGYWPNSKAKSPGPETMLFDSAAAAGQQYFPDPAVPRQLPFNVIRSITYQRPPPPSVEDETDSLAKEHGSVASSIPSEEPVYRGDPDQHPVLLPVNEHSSERRFVLVSSSSEASDESSTEDKKSRRKTRSSDRWSESESTTYESVTSRKSGPSTPYEDALDKNKKPESRSLRDRRRLDDLPTIVTNLGGCTPGSRDISRANSATRPDFPEDYFSPRPSSSAYYSPRPGSHYQSGTVSTPNVVENGRDISYHEGASSSSYHRRHHSAYPDQHGRNFPTDRKLKESLFRSAQPSPTYLKRYPDSPGQPRRLSKEGYEIPRQHTEPSSPMCHRKSSYAHAEWETSSQHSGHSAHSQHSQHSSSSSREKRSSPPGSGHYDSSDEELRLRSLPSHRRTSTLPEKVAYLGTPTQPRLIDRRRSKGQTPLPSPLATRSSYFEGSAVSSPRSVTFAKEPRTPRDDGRPERSLSRASTATSDTAGGVPVKNPAVVVTASSSSLMDPRRSVPALASRKAALKSSSRSASSTPSTPLASSPTNQRSWHPQKLELSRKDVSAGKHLPSYRRYSKGMKAGDLPDIPQCPRTREVAGHSDWLTLPHCDNFNICPSCYQANFASTEFAYHFVQAPVRSSDRPIACDFGTSQYYHIAWLFTRKYNKPDLSLFRSIAKIGAKSQPCSGYHEATRIWYSVKEPRTQRAIPNFTVCHSCAKAIEVLLPGLMGLFVPMDSPAEPTKGVCAMHQTDGRKRFVLYFDLMETAADQALATKSPPDVQALADRVRELALMPECAGSRPLRNKRWYTMRSIPDMVVCEECFEEVVWPYLERDDHDRDRDHHSSSSSSAGLAGDFVHRPQRLHLAACMLHSDRMRDIFHKAVRRRDTAYLSEKVTERYEKEREYHARLAELNSFALGPAEVDAEIEKLLREWKRWE